MKKRGFLLAGIGVLALAGPALVVARGGNPPSIFQLNSQPSFQTSWSTDAPAQTNSRQFRPIPNMPQGTELGIDHETPSALEVTVDLRGGKAKLRWNDPETGTDEAVLYPRAPLITGRGAQSVTFLLQDDDLGDPTLEWRKVGRKRVRAASVTVTGIGPLD